MGDEEVLPDWGYQIDRGIATDEDAFNDLLARAGRYRRQCDDDSASGAYRDALNAWPGQNAYEDVRAELVEAGRSRLAELRGSAVEEFASVLLDRPESGGPAEALELTASPANRFANARTTSQCWRPIAATGRPTP